MSEDKISLILRDIQKKIEKIKLHKILAIDCNVKSEVINLHDKTLNYLQRCYDAIQNNEVSDNHLNYFKIDIYKLNNLFPYLNMEIKDISQNQESTFKERIERQENSLNITINTIFFNLDFFGKLGFLNKNIVAIGANGSGKSSLTNKLSGYINQNGVIISAQRVLLIPNIRSISNPNETAKELKKYQLLDKTNKSTNLFSSLTEEFNVILKNLLAENIKENHDFRLNTKSLLKSGGTLTEVPKTKLDRTLEIWNSLMEQRIISSGDGINLNVQERNDLPYPIVQMSDGEKVMLFLIAQILQAPKSGFIVIDEPEMYLHKTILKKLWDILERERQDCIFLYLTHDLDFAISRITAKKVWIKSFKYPDKWEIEDIPENELPEELLLELLGSRKNILFCEGKKGSVDETVYNILFPNLTIVPVESCLAVINYTKSFNKTPTITTKAYGIIDSDYQKVERLNSLLADGIFHFKLSEIENIFLDDFFLESMAKRFHAKENCVVNIKSKIIEKFKNDVELQVSNYLSAKINYYFKDSDIIKGNKLEQIKNNYENFTQKIDINTEYSERENELKTLIQENNYEKIITYYNNKGLKQIAEHYLGIKDFTDKSIQQLRSDPALQDNFKKYFPKELLNIT